MKAITLWQPWASLIALGCKSYETRDWGISYRGPLAIHAAKKNPILLLKEIPINDIRLIATKVGPFDLLPLGAVLCVVNITSVLKTENLKKRPGFIDSEEYLFGDYSNGRKAWRMEKVRRFEAPIPTGGRQGIWEWKCPPGVLENTYREDYRQASHGEWTMQEDVESFA